MPVETTSSKINAGFAGHHAMNTANTDTTPDRPISGRSARSTINQDELSQLKRELMQAEVRLAKARATVVSTEIDLKVLNARLRALAK